MTTFLFEAANFLVLAAALGWMFFQPARQAIADHRAKFASDNERAMQMLADAEKTRKDIQRSYENLESELNARRTEELSIVKAQSEKMVANAKTAAAREIEQSRQHLLRLTENQRDLLAGVVANVTADTVGQLLEQIESADLQSVLVRKACQELLKLPASPPGSVTVETARPLTDDERSDLSDALGAAADGARYNTDSRLGMGIRISTSNGLVDASKTGLREFARKSIAETMEKCSKRSDTRPGIHHV